MSDDSLKETIAEDFRGGLEELKVNNNPLINALTKTAHTHRNFAPTITAVIERHFADAKFAVKLCTINLIDSIVKYNGGGPYKKLFASMIVGMVLETFAGANTVDRASLYVLRSGWNRVGTFGNTFVESETVQV